MADNGTFTPAIEVRLERASQLFNTLDPFPFPERDLDKDAEEFIVGWARELPRNRPITIVIHLPADELKREDEKAIATSLNRYFDYRAGIAVRDLNELFRVGRTALLVGLTVLAACSAAAQLPVRFLGDTASGRFLQESLIILGWVANWKPLEIFLYDWWPLLRRRKLYRRLAEAKVEFRCYETE